MILRRFFRWFWDFFFQLNLKALDFFYLNHLKRRDFFSRCTEIGQRSGAHKSLRASGPNYVFFFFRSLNVRKMPRSVDMFHIGLGPSLSRLYQVRLGNSPMNFSTPLLPAHIRRIVSVYPWTILHSKMAESHVYSASHGYWFTRHTYPWRHMSLTSQPCGGALSGPIPVRETANMAFSHLSNTGLSMDRRILIVRRV